MVGTGKNIFAGAQEKDPYGVMNESNNYENEN